MEARYPLVARRQAFLSPGPRIEQPDCRVRVIERICEMLPEVLGFYLKQREILVGHAVKEVQEALASLVLSSKTKNSS
jgi:hypothetical protein